MPTLKNTTDQPITASTGHSVAPGGKLTVTAATLARISQERYIAVQLQKERLIVEPDPAPAEAEGITRSDIAKANRAELLEMILAHYPDRATAEDFASIRVEDKDGEDGLRTIAARLIFADL